MKKFVAFLIVFVIIGAGVLAGVKNKHRRQRAKKAHQIKQMRQMVRMVRFMYEDVCSNREASIIAAALSIKELGKKGKIDAPKYLHQILKKLKKQSLRNFVRFLIVDSYKEKKQAQEMVGELMNLVDENTGQKTKAKKSDKKAKAPLKTKAKKATK